MNTLELLEQDLMAYEDDDDLEKDLPESTIIMQSEPPNSNSPDSNFSSFPSSSHHHRPDGIEIEEDEEEVIVQNHQQVVEEIIEEITSLRSVQEKIETSSSLAISDIQASDEKEQPIIVQNQDLPSTKTSTSKEASQKSSAKKKRKSIKTKEVIPLEEEEETLLITEDYKRIQDLPISEATKKLIFEKYYRTADHPDIAKFKEFEKKPTALLYEVFASVFREKSAFEFDAPVVGPKGANQYTAHHILNRERLASGTGSSKQTAKAVASFKALQILAPSLAERCRIGGFILENEELFSNGTPAKISSEKIPSVEKVPPQQRAASEKVPTLVEKPLEKVAINVEKVTAEKKGSAQKASRRKIPAENQDILGDMEKLLETIDPEKVAVSVEKSPEKVVASAEKASTEKKVSTQKASRRKTPIKNKEVLEDMEKSLETIDPEEAVVSVEKVTAEKKGSAQKASRRKTPTENKDVLGDMEKFLEAIDPEEVLAEKKESPKKALPQQIDLSDPEFFESLKELPPSVPVPIQENKRNPDEEEFEQMMMIDLFLEEENKENPKSKPKKPDVLVPQKKDPIPTSQKKLIPYNPSKNSIPKSKPKEPNEILCDPINGLQINVQLPSFSDNQNNIDLAEIKEKCRDKGIKKLLEILAEILKKDPKTRIDPQAPKHPEIGKALKYYCSNTIFTKLYMLHCLVNKQEANASLQINTLYFESECFVYLYSTELEQTFMYKSNSLIFSIEMAKYFLIYELYSKCFTIAEIIQTMRSKIEKPQENTTFKQNYPHPEPIYQKQQETTPFYQKEKPMYQPVYRGNPQSYYSTTDKSSASATVSSDSLNSTKSNVSAANNRNNNKLSTNNGYGDYNKENHLGLNRNNLNKNETRKKAREDDDDLFEIREPPVKKGIRLRDSNLRRPNCKGQSTKVLAEIEDDLEYIFSDSDDDVKVMKNKKPVVTKKPAQRNGVKDLMIEDLDDL